MALFSRKKTVVQSAATTAVTPRSTRVALASDTHVSSVLIRPLITEKAVGQGDRNVYVFVVRRDATKYHVRAAVAAVYNVTPMKVNIVNKAPATRLRGMSRTTKKVPGQKKAYVYLKKGETIALV